MKASKRKAAAGWLLILGVTLTACGPGGAAPAPPADQGLKIVATTTFIGETVERVAGDLPDLYVLLQPGQNPHAYQPSPRDMVQVSAADLLFSNGFGLEEFLPDLLAGGDSQARLVEVSQGIRPLKVDGSGHEMEEDHPGEGTDPHVWFDPNNILVWVDNITAALVEVDPDHAGIYQENAAAYKLELQDLDGWIRNEVNTIPPENRKLVTDHTLFGYFADEYGFTQIGAVIPAPTTEAETSGQELASLMEVIQKQDVKAVFVSFDLDSSLAEVVAEDTGVTLVPLYFGSLTSGGPADSYIDFMHYNVEAIVSALQD